MIPSELQRVFRFAPGRVLVLRPDAAFTIVAASVAYLQTTHTDESIFGRPLFEVFPDNPAFGAPGAKRLAESLQRVILTRAPDAMLPTSGCRTCLTAAKNSPSISKTALFTTSAPSIQCEKK